MSQPVGLNFRSRIPTFSDDASVVEAFKVYHYGVDDYSTQPIPDDSIEGNFRTLTTSLNAVNSTIAGLTTTYVPRISSVSLPNIITPENLNVVPLTIRGAASQSENLQRWQNSTNTNLAVVFSNGAISSNSYLNVGSNTQSTTTALNVVVGNPAHKGVVIRQSGSQTANIQEWQNSIGDTIATVSSVGYLGIGTNVTSSATAADIRISSAAHKGITVRSATSQSGNLQEWQNSSGTALSWVNPNGIVFSEANEVAIYDIARNVQSGTNYTFAVDDSKKIVIATNASAKTFLISLESSVSWTSNAILRVINSGAGPLTISGQAGVTITNSNTTIGINESAEIIKTGTNTWQLVSGGGSSKSEALVDVSHSSNTVTLDATLGNVFFLTNTPSANLTINITNALTINGNIFTINLMVTQGSTGRIPSALNINGGAVSIRWPSGVAPTPTSSSGKIDIFTFVVLRRADSFTALGSFNVNF